MNSIISSEIIISRSLYEVAIIYSFFVGDLLVFDLNIQ
jgi:hypothetical protein